MVDAFTTAPFSIGTSSTLGVGADKSMDMSLDELIKARRGAETKKNDNTSRRNTTRKSLKSPPPTNNSKSKSTSNVQKSIGTNKAKRNARNAAKRGITSNNKPNPMDIEREVFRQQRFAGGGEGGGGGKGSGGGVSSSRVRANRRQANRMQDNNMRSEAERKVKAKNLAGGRKKNNNDNRQHKGDNKPNTIKAPPRKAVNAAMRAMNSAGYDAPQGMKMIISFAPVADKKKSNKKQTGNGNSNNQKGKRNR